MKKMNWFSTLLILAIVIVFANGCKKENDSGNSSSNPTVTDIDGNVYHTVTIGTQVWMVENLKTTHYRNGDLIGTTVSANSDISNEIAPEYQWAYAGNDSNVAVYGRLYTWFVVTDNRNVCPAGWHVPTSTEMTTLLNYLGGEAVAGGKLKETGTVHWGSPNTGATNATNFTALPGGFRDPDGTFNSIGYGANWWSSSRSESDSISAYLMDVGCDNSKLFISIYWNLKGHSIRCIKD